MEKINIDYAVIILNYNTSKDAIKAAISVNNCSGDKSYIICIADNASTIKEDREKLSKIEQPNTIFFQIERNEGYANGNNQAIRFVNQKYEPRFVVIMNPDVLIINKLTIDDLLDKLEKYGNGYCGIQPLVWTPHKGNARYQVNIRRCFMTYKDVVINKCSFLSPIYSKRNRYLLYTKERPYCDDIDFEVPSGAFFIIRKDDFFDVRLFDDSTFLYMEEYILGLKLKMIGKKFILSPSHIVQHEGGKSIGTHKKRPIWHLKKYDMDSTLIYMKEYLMVNTRQLLLFRFLYRINFVYSLLRYYI